ncbi:MAG: ABC transporter substrate-binding protein [Janthinobacterium lividum]
MHRALPCLALLAALMPLVAARAVKVPHRVVSLNLCADQYLLAVADRSQIAALTRFARDRSMSEAAAAAARLPYSGGRAEELLALQPDLVLAAPYQAAATAALLGTAVVSVPEANDVAQIAQNLVTVGRAVGHVERAQILIAKMSRELSGTGPGRGRVGAYYQRQGYLTGGGTLVDDLMRRAGLVNLATRLHRPSLSRLSLESVIAERPDFLILTRDPRHGDRGSDMLDHPALAAAVPASRRLYLDEALIICGGPAYPAAVEGLRKQIIAADLQQARKITP